METELKKGFIKTINVMIKRGDMSGRGRQKYTLINTFTVNCLGHAFFNFKNSGIRRLRRSFEDEIRNFFWNFNGFKLDPYEAYESVTQELEQRICETGLLIEECKLDDKLDKGQWKVAYYFDFDKNDADFHFMRQEEDGTWTSKMGSEMTVERFKKLPKVFMRSYHLQKIYKVTNPYIYNENGEENE